MATASKKTKTLYKGSDLVDKFLFNELAKYVKHDNLASMAKYLGVRQTEISSDILAADSKIAKVSSFQFHIHTVYLILHIIVFCLSNKGRGCLHA